MIKALGGTLREIEDAKLATHVIADNPLGRSTKLMAALNVTPHVVNLAWLVDSAKAGKLLRLPNKKYSLLDKIRMDRIAANIENHTPLLKNVQVYVCSRVASYKAQNIKEKSTPKIEHFKSIVEAAGGEWRTNLATCSKLGIGKKLVIITSVERKKAAAQMAVKSVVAALKLEGVYQKTTDWLFDGMMEQTSIEF
jgi:predicted RNase H-like nuclease